MKIVVTQEMIDNGEPGRCSGCPLALAFRVVGIPAPFVFTRHIEFFDASGNNVVQPLPWEASDQIERNDWGRGMQPFEFDMPALDGVVWNQFPKGAVE